MILFRKCKKDSDKDVKSDYADNNVSACKLNLLQLHELLQSIIEGRYDDIRRKADHVIGGYNDNIIINKYYTKYYHDEVSIYVDKINKLLHELHRSAIAIERSKGRYKSSELTEQLISLIDRSRSTVTSVISNVSKYLDTHEYIERVSLKEYYNYVYNLHDNVRRILNNIGDVVGVHRRILYEFFPKETKELKEILSQLKQEEELLAGIVKNIKDRIDDVEDSLNLTIKIKRTREEYNSISIKISELSARIKDLNLKEEEVSSIIASINCDANYTSLVKIYNEYKQKYDSSLGEVGMMISKISRVMSKYAYEVGFSKEEMLILNNISGSIANIVDVDTHVFKYMLNKASNAIKNGKIQVKDKEKDGKNIAILLANIDNYVNTLREYNNNLNKLSMEITRYSNRLSELNTTLQSIKSERMEYENAFMHHTILLDSLSSYIDTDMRRLEEKLSNIFTVRIELLHLTN